MQGCVLLVLCPSTRQNTACWTLFVVMCVAASCPPYCTQCPVRQCSSAGGRMALLLQDVELGLSSLVAYHSGASCGTGCCVFAGTSHQHYLCKRCTRVCITYDILWRLFPMASFIHRES
ncbi:hypothetical protein COO60DRAFT_1502708 [Scenedesmus sp. NREL 46B-D3]|nr:hypothetical protein COO60DRAFT_1502708 [Scenedesmus sp. NREL 46B-D3]